MLDVGKVRRGRAVRHFAHAVVVHCRFVELSFDDHAGNKCSMAVLEILFDKVHEEDVAFQVGVFTEVEPVEGDSFAHLDGCLRLSRQ